MEFVRQNLVLIVVAVVVVVVGGVLLTANMSMSTSIDVAIAERQGLSGDLTRLDKKRINEKIVEAEQARVTEVKASQSEVIAQSVDWNRRNLVGHMLSAVVIGPAGAPIKVQAFPAKTVTYDEYLKFNLTQAYTEQLPALIEPLKVATPPTNQDVAAAVPAATRRLQRISDEFKTASPSDPKLTAAATNLAREMVRQDSAQGKHIYVDPGALEYVFNQPTTDVTPEQLWAAQLSLWVTADVLEAIRLTNQQVVDEAIAQGAASENVGLSGVRRLLSLRVYGYMPPGVGQGGLSVTPPSGSSRTLTQRRSSPLHDVVFYELSVIMPVRHVADFERVLMSHNYHTVLNVSMHAIAQSPADLHYYGPGPVMQVTFSGELLLLTGWQRGTWDAKASAWSPDYPPLMPVSVLRTQPAQALREEDRRRLK